MTTNAKLPPPKGYDSWLDYAIATMETRELHLQSLWDAGEATSYWGREVQSEEMTEAAKEELSMLRKAVGA